MKIVHTLCFLMLFCMSNTYLVCMDNEPYEGNIIMSDEMLNEQIDIHQTRQDLKQVKHMLLKLTIKLAKSRNHARLLQKEKQQLKQQNRQLQLSRTSPYNTNNRKKDNIHPKHWSI